MKKLIIILLVFGFIFPGYSINEYEEGDTLYNWAKSGLKLRSKRSLNSEALDLILYGEPLIVLELKELEHPNNQEVIDTYKVRESDKDSISLKGRWVKINYKGKVGFVFDCYLSKFQAPNEELIRRYLFNKFEVIKFYEKLNVHEEGIERVSFNDGFYLKSILTGSTAQFKLVAPEMSFEEAFLLSYNLSGYVVSIENRPNEGIYINLECGYYKINVVENTAVIISEFGC